MGERREKHRNRRHVISLGCVTTLHCFPRVDAAWLLPGFIYLEERLETGSVGRA